MYGVSNTGAQNSVKDKKQRECLNTWYAKGCKGTLELPTGVGKSRTGVLAAEYIVKLKPNANILILTPTQIIRDSAWRDEFTKWGHTDIFEKNVEAVCIQTACKYEDNHYDLVIADEIHNYIPVTDDYVYYKFFENNNIDKLLGLSASIEADLLPKLKLIAPIVFTMSINKAVDLGLVAPFTVINVPVKLTVSERFYYRKFNETFAETFGVFNKDLQLMFKCLKNKKLYRAHLIKHFNASKASPDECKALFKQYEAFPYKCNEAMRERKSILYNAHHKLKMTKQFSELFNDRKGIVFSETSKSADEIQIILGDRCVTEHSKIRPASKRRKNIEKFQDGRTKVDRISTVRSLNEGANLKGVEFIIVASGTSKLKSFLQRTGRSIRYEEGKKAIIIRLFVKETQEEKWMISSQEGYKVHEVTDFQEAKTYLNLNP